MPPAHFGRWRTVCGSVRGLARRFLFQTIRDVALMLDRKRAGREASPAAAVIDGRPVKAPHGDASATSRWTATPVRRRPVTASS